MSRETFQNEKYELAIGVDHALGAFFQIWEEGYREPEGDLPGISASEQFGFAVNDMAIFERNKKLEAEINRYRSDVRYLRDAEVVVKIAKACGFEVKKEVYKLWD